MRVAARALLVALLSLVVVASAPGAANGATLRSGSFDPPRPAPEFDLQGSDGSSVTIGRFRGKVVALGFGYTSCADVCPTTLALLAEARKALGAAAKDFQVLYVTVDPERDTAQRLRKYMDTFDPTFIGVTGAAQRLADMRAAYGVTMTKVFSKLDPGAYTIHHSSFVYLIDRGGRLRAMVPFGATPLDVTHDIETLLQD